MDAVRFVAELTGASNARRGRTLQTLWSGYGELFRVELDGKGTPSVIVKAVKPPVVGPGASAAGQRSHARKCRSYEVETTFYRSFAGRCDDACRVPKLVGSRRAQNEWLLVLEDLDAAGFPSRARRADRPTLESCLRWLAAFHARFLGVEPTQLWKTGTYWHLATRPDELANTEDVGLRSAAATLDRRLSSATFKTLVHGDAKLANFCFSRSGGVAAVDFQYVGGGCGMKDVAYLLAGEDAEGRLLDHYFDGLRKELAPTVDASAVEAEWRELYPLACADFSRFLAGWAKESWRRDVDGQRRARAVLATLDAGG